MPSVIFVHGTGGREHEYEATLRQIDQALQGKRPGISLVPCLWGDSLGANLNANGASIPSYPKTGGDALEELNTTEEKFRLWEALYRDPFYEMRLLGLRSLQGDAMIPPGMQSPSAKLESRVAGLTSLPDLKAKLDQLEIGGFFQQACAIVLGPTSKPFSRLLDTAPSNLDEDYLVIARSLVAMCRTLCKQRNIFVLLLANAKLRDEAVEAIRLALSQGEESKGIGDWVKDRLSGTVLNFGTNHLVRKRGAVMDAAYPFAGDILVYQANGEKIRKFIKDQIESDTVEPPVVLLAHSLGGIACVDLLIEHDLRQKVSVLVTVGSQAPFFYEIGALKTLAYGASLPQHFPETWLNIYDLKDMLSYVGDVEGIFPQRIHDKPVDNGEPFPEAHSAYWGNPETWDEIEKILP